MVDTGVKHVLQLASSFIDKTEFLNFSEIVYM